MWTCLAPGNQVADIDKARLKNDWEIITKKCFKLKWSKAIKNNIKEVSKLTELSKHL